jgi:hypothetical protein
VPVLTRRARGDIVEQLEIKFVGFDKDSFNYGYTSNGKMRATAQYEGFTTFGQGDRLGFWLEYFYPSLDLTVHVYLNDVRLSKPHPEASSRASVMLHTTSSSASSSCDSHVHV